MNTRRALEGFSTEELLDEVICRMDGQANNHRSNREVGREFSLAKTAAEEARWRAGRGATHRGPKPSDVMRERLTDRQGAE